MTEGIVVGAGDAAALRNDSNSMENLVRENIDGVYSLMYRMLDHKEDAEDRTQEVFVRALRAFSSYRGEAKLSTWLYRIAINVGRDAIAMRQRDRSRDGGEVVDRHMSSHGAPEEDLESREDHRMLIEALGRITDEKRELILLADMEGQSHDAIAEILAVPSGTVKSRLHRARAALRDEVKRIMGGAE